MTQLPYSFDLLWDFKTVKQLHDHLTGRQRYATSATDFELITLAQELNVPLPDSINAEPPLAVAIKARGGRVPETATHYFISVAARYRNGTTGLHLHFFRKVDSEWQKFITDTDDEYPQWAAAIPRYHKDTFNTHVLPNLRRLEGNK